MGNMVGGMVGVPIGPEMPWWRWCVPIAGRGGSVGADQKVFRGQEIDQPGDLATNKPGAKATIFVREVVQNAVDAADDLRKKLAEAGNDEVPELEVKFEFKALTGDAKASLVSGTDLVNYVDTAERAGFKELEFPDESRLVDLDDPSKPLNVLYIHERGSTGMYGSFESCESKMHLALLSVQAGDKPPGAGGAFGYGKAGLVKAAGSKIIFAYSCFEATENEDGSEDDEERFEEQEGSEEQHGSEAEDSDDQASPRKKVLV